MDRPRPTWSSRCASPRTSCAIPRKRVWLLHQLRQYYEYYEQTLAAGDPEETAALRGAWPRWTGRRFPGAARLWAMSGRIAERLERFNGIKSTPTLHPPLPTEEGFYRGRQDRYVFAPSRLERHKRQWLLIEAMRHVRSGVKAVIGGEGGAYRDYEKLNRGPRPRRSRDAVRKAAARHAGRVVRQQPRRVLRPRDEDYGYITLEAMLSGKPVVTCRDSGGTLDFVADGVTGFVTDPDPQAIAATHRCARRRPTGRARDWAGGLRVATASST
jgi:glycosyltransferase involved in cell wall biosynthesis